MVGRLIRYLDQLSIGKGQAGTDKTRDAGARDARDRLRAGQARGALERLWSGYNIELRLRHIPG